MRYTIIWNVENYNWENCAILIIGIRPFVGLAVIINNTNFQVKVGNVD